MGCLQLVGSLKLQVSFAEYSLFCRALLQKRPINSKSLLVEATPYMNLRASICIHDMYYQYIYIYIYYEDAVLFGKAQPHNFKSTCVWLLHRVTLVTNELRVFFFVCDCIEWLWWRTELGMILFFVCVWLLYKSDFGDELNWDGGGRQVDWFWLRGWLVHKGAICTGTAPLFWNFHLLIRGATNISTKNRKSVLVYCAWLLYKVTFVTNRAQMRFLCVCVYKYTLYSDFRDELSRDGRKTIYVRDWSCVRLP